MPRAVISGRVAGKRADSEASRQGGIEAGRESCKLELALETGCMSYIISLTNLERRAGTATR